MKKTNWIVDIETLSNCSIFCFLDYGSEERHHFGFWKDVNDFEELYKFLKRNVDLEERHVTFNGLAFDSQIIQWLLDNEETFMFEDGNFIATQIYGYAQHCIQKSNAGEWSDYPPWKIQIPQLDLLKMGHWDAMSAKSASLKWLQCAIDWPNVEDMPYSHNFYVETREQYNEIISYCFNDCGATKRVLYICKDAVGLRKDLTAEYGIDLWSASEPRMSKELFLHFLSEKSGIDKKELKRFNTFRDNIEIKSIILPYVHFERQEFVMLLNNFKKLTVQGDALRGAFNYNVQYRGISIDYGMGGIHGIAPKGVYNSTADYYIKSVDVSSFYPNLCIHNRWAPAHINRKLFCDQYLWFYEERKKHKKGSAKNKALKLLLNSTFGLSIDKNSFLSDPQLGVSITVNGQLLLTMLLEMLCEAIPDAQPLVMNTDGIEIMIHKDREPLFKEICERWEQKTNLVLEYDKYKTILSFDCNNYIGLYENGKIKGKGRFEYEPHDRYEIDVLHKNKSFLVTPKAVAAYFFKGIPPEEFLKNHTNIYDFCGFARAKGKWKFIKVTSEKGNITETEIQKTLRYYVSNSGSKVVKRKIEFKPPPPKKETWELGFDDIETLDKIEVEKDIQVLAGKYYITPFNKYIEKPIEEYDLDFSFYLREINKEIRGLQKSQLKQHQ